MSGVVLSAKDILNGARGTGHNHRTTGLTQPRQMLSRKEKDEDWGMANLDWGESIGTRTVEKRARKMLKNYRMANGIIDRSDYIVERDNEHAELIETLTKDDSGSALELKFYPLIPRMINLLVGEFAKRSDKILYIAKDELSTNEYFSEKKEQVTASLLADAERRQMETLIQQGADPESEEFKQLMDPATLRSLPDIEAYMAKDYRNPIEDWASHQHNEDEERFGMRELELYGFKDKLIVDCEFWHMMMGEDDYSVELWNPVYTFYHKSPDVRYVSDGDFVGKFDMMSTAEVINRLGWMMDEDQMENLQGPEAESDFRYLMPFHNDGGFYDNSKSKDWNQTGPSLGMRQNMAIEKLGGDGDGLLTALYRDTGDGFFNSFGTGMHRVMTYYWKTFRKWYWITRVTRDGIKASFLADEDYVVTDRPVYDTTLRRAKTEKNLIYGEHKETVWAPEVWSGIKVGRNTATGMASDSNSSDPIYLNVRPLKFQFHGEFSLWGAKLPVEGTVFNERNTKSMSFVDSALPWQVGFNLVNNQIADILIDELGTIIVFDQNTLPKHSLSEDFDGNPMQRAYVGMKDFSMLPLDTSLSNTQQAVNFQHYQQLDLEQSKRLMSRIQLSNYYKESAFEAVGITPERRGSAVSQDSAQGTEMMLNRSFAQTEMIFIEHSEHLMPRVHRMRTELARWYNCTKPSARLSYLTSNELRKTFEIEGMNLELRDLHLHLSTKVNHRHIMDQMKQLALTNNTSGASIFDLGDIIRAESVAEMQVVMQRVESNTERRRQEEFQARQQDIKLSEDAETAREEARLSWEAEQNQLDREYDLMEAEAKAVMGQKGDSNGESDYFDAMDRLDERRLKTESFNHQRESDLRKEGREARKQDFSERQLRSRERIAELSLQQARANKNRYDVKEVPKKK